jgi:hypothetical protein
MTGCGGVYWWRAALPRQRATDDSIFPLVRSGLFRVVVTTAPCSHLVTHGPVEEVSMARKLVIVSRTKPGTYTYMKLVSESEDVVILDRRNGDRRRIHQRATPERRFVERRRRDVMTDLHKSGWALVRR